MLNFSWLDGAEVNFAIAFLAGLLTFFASCLLPLVPTYLAYLSGVSLNNPDREMDKWRVFRFGLLFVIGFIATFMLLGLSVYHLNNQLGFFKNISSQIAGVIFIIMSLMMLGVFKHPIFFKEKRWRFKKMKGLESLSAILTGVAFGFGWSPCIGPVLAVILFWASRAETAFMGSWLLFAFGLGLGIPFLIIALGFEKIVPWLKKNAKISQIANHVSAGLIMIVGVLLLLGKFQNISLYLLRLVNISPFSI